MGASMAVYWPSACLDCSACSYLLRYGPLLLSPLITHASSTKTDPERCTQFSLLDLPDPCATSPASGAVTTNPSISPLTANFHSRVVPNANVVYV